MTIKKCVIAGAGSGKTTYLLNLALGAPSHENVLYLTYTDAAAIHFESRIKSLCGAMPKNITVMTWFSFLLVHGVRPFPHPLPGIRPHGISFVEGKVAQKKGIVRGRAAYYFANGKLDIYSSRLSDLACLCDDQVDGDAVGRISDMFQLILVDEAQDFSGYDFDYLAKLFRTPSSVVVVGDPRQRTYTTTKEGPNCKKTFFEYVTEQKLCEIDSDSLAVCYRCKQDVVDLANALFPGLPALRSSEQNDERHIKILSRRESAVSHASFQTAMHLGWSSSALPLNNCAFMTMGAAKGSEFEDVVVWLTKPMEKWIDDKRVELKPTARAKLYVAITRARNDLYLVRP